MIKWNNATTNYGCQQKQRIFVFLFFKIFCFFAKNGDQKQKTKKCEISPNKPIKISNLNRFYTNISLRTDCYLVCSMNSAKIFDARAFLN